MNNKNEVSTDSHLTTPATDPALSGKIFLDKPLPSLVTMGILIALIVVLSVLSGWKIVNLEQERTVLVGNQIALDKDRTQFEKDIQTHSEILIQLPKLRTQQQGADVKLVETEAHVKAAEGSLAALANKTNKVEEEYLIFKNKITDSQILLTTNQKKTEELKKEQAVLEQKNAEFSVNISNQQNRHEAAKKDAMTEQKRLAELKDSIVQYEKRLAELDATIRKLTGSEAPIANLTEQLTGLKTQIGDIVKDASTASKTLGTASQQVTSDASVLTASVNKASEATTAIQKVSGQIDGLSERFATRQKNLDQGMTTFTNTIDAIATVSNDKLMPAISAVKEKSDQFSEISKRLSDERQTITKDMEELSKSIETLKGMSEKIKSANDSLKSQQKDMTETVTKLELSISRIEKLPKELSIKNDSVFQAVEVISSVAQDVKSASDKLGVVINSLERNSKDIESSVKPGLKPSFPEKM